MKTSPLAKSVESSQEGLEVYNHKQNIYYKFHISIYIFEGRDKLVKFWAPATVKKKHLFYFFFIRYQFSCLKF